MSQVFKIILSGLVLAFALAGCSTTGTEEVTEAVEQVAPTDQAVRTGVEDSLVEPQVEVEPAPVDPLAGVDTVFYFDFDKSLLSSEARSALILHAEQLQINPRKIRLEGHGDERGTREYNLALGERRADSVRGFLIQQGVDAANIEVISYGEERPADLGSTESAWSKNRRVELK